jgi:hypothetical protein
MTESSGAATGSALSSLVLPALGRGGDRDYVIATLTARMQLLAENSSAELFVHVAEGSAPEQILAELTGTAGTARGWEGTVFPTNTRRRRLTLPPGVRVTRGLAEILLVDEHDLDPRVLATVNDPLIAAADSFVLHVDNQVRGCIPALRLTATTVSFRAVVHDKALLADDLRRRSFLRLAAWSTACDIHLAEGSTVITWMPDDGDPINDFKIQVAAPDWLTHWVTYRVLPHHLMA